MLGPPRQSTKGVPKYSCYSIYLFQDTTIIFQRKTFQLLPHPLLPGIKHLGRTVTNIKCMWTWTRQHNDDHMGHTIFNKFYKKLCDYSLALSATTHNVAEGQEEDDTQSQGHHHCQDKVKQQILSLYTSRMWYPWQLIPHHVQHILVWVWTRLDLNNKIITGKYQHIANHILDNLSIP